MKRFLLQICAIFAIMAFSGCISAKKNVEYSAETGRPQVWTVYIPYRDHSPQLVDVVPVPNYDTWTEERMKRDIQRMVQAGIQGVLLKVSPEQLADPFKMARLIQFRDHCRRDGRLKTALYLDSSKPLALNCQDLLRHLAKHGFLAGPEQNDALNGQNLTLNGRPLIVVGRNLKLEGHNAKEVNWRQFGLQWPDLPDLETESQTAYALQSADSIVWLRVGYCGSCSTSDNRSQKNHWSISRGRKGNAFRDRLAAARREGTRILAIDSWNDYDTGSFLEPNTRDQFSCMDILREELP